MLVFSSGGLCSTLRHKNGRFHWDDVDQPHLLTLDLENRRPFTLWFDFPAQEVGWAAVMERWVCDCVHCILADLTLFNLGCLSYLVTDLFCPSSQQPPVRLGFSSRVFSSALSVFVCWVLFVYGLLVEEKQVLSFLELKTLGQGRVPAMPAFC